MNVDTKLIVDRPCNLDLKHRIFHFDFDFAMSFGVELDGSCLAVVNFVTEN